MRVYVLSKTAYMAEKSDYGEGWEKAWTDPDGKRLLPFREAPKGSATMTAEEARAYQAQFTPEPEPIPEPEPEPIEAPGGTMTHIRNVVTNAPLCGAKGPMGAPSDCPDCDALTGVPPELRPWAYGDEPPDDDWHDTEARMWGDDPEPLQTSDTEDT